MKIFTNRQKIAIDNEQIYKQISRTKRTSQKSS